MGKCVEKGKLQLALSVVLAFCLSGGCTNVLKLRSLNKNGCNVEVSMATEAAPPSVRDSLLESSPEDRITVIDNQGEVLIMDAVKDEQSGEMVISQRIPAVVVEAKFRNVAERNGYVDIAFDVKVPKQMQQSAWQVRLEPRLHYLKDTLHLEKIYITGEKYRRGQVRGYELYNRFLSTIIPDTCDFFETYTCRHLLETFMQRHFKEIAALASDTSYVEYSLAENLFGVTVKQTLEHYTRQFLIKRNDRRKGRKSKMFAKYIKAPLPEGGVRLDTIISGPDSMLVYRYVQSVRTCRNLRKIDMVMDGGIFREEKKIYHIPKIGPLTYYISSMTHFADNSVRYLKRIISRNATANTAAYIVFKVGDATLCDTLYDNRSELKRIKDNVASLLSDKSYIVDSLVVTASCSPEGSYASNERLAQRRANAIERYFSDYIKNYTDSVGSAYWRLDLSEEDGSEEEIVQNGEELNVTSRHIAENWEQLERILRSDSAIYDKYAIERALLLQNPDEREKALSRSIDYPYIRSAVYPLLRAVRFDFYLHRRGMIKDTVHTTVVDTTYMNGVDALLGRDYEKAVTLLRPYGDINSAVAYICMDYNESARQVLENLPETAARSYMLAIVWARFGNEQKAVEYFLDSVNKDGAMRHRGNLDPEIAALIRRYNLNVIFDKNVNQF